MTSERFANYQFCAKHTSNITVGMVTIQVLCSADSDLFGELHLPANNRPVGSVKDLHVGHRHVRYPVVPRADIFWNLLNVWYPAIPVNTIGRLRVTEQGR